jgi:hypothetical protein
MVLSLALPIFFILAQDSGTLSPQLADITFILFTGVCALLAFMLVRRAGVDGRLGLMHLGMFTGMLLIFLGAVANGVYAMILQSAALFAPVADALNFLGYASAALGGFQFVWYFRTAFSEWRFKVVPLLGLLVAGRNLILLHPRVATQLPLILDANWFAYPILDGILVIMATMMLLLFSGGIVALSWRWLAMGMLLIAIADVTVGVGNSYGWGQLVRPFYLFYLWGYICLGLGFSLMPSLERLQTPE